MVRAVFALFALDFALIAPAAAAFGGLSAFALGGDIALAATALLLRRGGLTAATVFWTLLFGFQCLRLGSILAMGQEGLLFDLLYLMRHTWVLGADLVGGWMYPTLIGIIALLGGLVWLVRALFGWVAEGLALPRGRWLLGGLWVLTVLGAVLPVAQPPVTWVTPVLVQNIIDSVAVYNEAERLVVRASRPDPGPVPNTGPDVHIYIIESYGAMLFRNAEQAEVFKPILQTLREDMAKGGWQSASAFSKAPVSGGRSWIADASVMLGVPVAHESTYQHLMKRIDGFSHMPRWLRSQGWHTVLCRPKDRERPGVSLADPFGFDTTVFFDELDYEGPHFGWGWIPDQYTLGHLRQDVLPTLAGKPTFLFVHLASAHVPWFEPPPIMRDWRSFNTLGAEEENSDRALQDELGFTANRFKRGPKGLGPTLRRHMGFGEPAERYREMVVYDLNVLRDHMLAMKPTRPTVVFIMGDHQPPGIAPRHDFSVPVHVFASEQGLLAPLQDFGFQRGLWLPPHAAPTIGHEDLFPAIAALLGARR